jgi:hypothetical protein
VRESSGAPAIPATKASKTIAMSIRLIAARLVVSSRDKCTVTGDMLALPAATWTW